MLVEELFLRTNVSLERILTNKRFSRSYSYEQTFLSLVFLRTNVSLARFYAHGRCLRHQIPPAALFLRPMDLARSARWSVDTRRTSTTILRLPSLLTTRSSYKFGERVGGIRSGQSRCSYSSNTLSKFIVTSSWPWQRSCVSKVSSVLMQQRRRVFSRCQICQG